MNQNQNAKQLLVEVFSNKSYQSLVGRKVEACRWADRQQTDRQAGRETYRQINKTLHFI
jgi:hypothetical protein